MFIINRSSFFKIIIKNQRGSSLVIALMATIGLGVVSYLIMEDKANMNKNLVRNNADVDIKRAVDRITAIFTSPAHCNANLRNRSFVSPYDSLTAIRECSGGNCNGTGTPVTVMNLNDFEMFVGDQKTKARIFSLTYSLTAQQSTDNTGVRPRAGVQYHQPAVVTLSVIFEKNIGYTPAGVIKTVRTKPYTIDAYVVTSLYNHTTRTLTDRATGTIYGCARSPASTAAF